MGRSAGSRWKEGGRMSAIRISPQRLALMADAQIMALDDQAIEFVRSYRRGLLSKSEAARGIRLLMKKAHAIADVIGELLARLGPEGEKCATTVRAMNRVIQRQLVLGLKRLQRKN